MIKKSIFSIIAVFCCFLFGLAQQTILALNSTTKTVSQLDATNGSVLNPTFINLTTLSPGTIKAITQVDDKLWISDQSTDKIYIYTLSGNYESTITAGIDNIRGLNVVNNEVWVTNEGDENGAAPNSIVRFSKAGVNLGNYATITSPFDVLDLGDGTALVSSFSAAGISKISYAGITVAPFVPANIIKNAEQLNFNTVGNVICAVFSASGTNPAGVYEFSNTGAIVNKWPITTGYVRGTIALNDGNYLVSTSTGLYTLNAGSGSSSLIVAGNYQFFTRIDPTLAVNENPINSVSLYPNPVTDQLNISGKEELVNVTVYSTTGQLIFEKTAKGKSLQIDFSKLASGVYLVKVQNKSLRMETFKVIKQ